MTILTWNSSYTFLSKNKNKKKNKPDNKSEIFFYNCPSQKLKDQE